MTLFFPEPMDASPKPFSQATLWVATTSLALDTSRSPGFLALSKAAHSHFFQTSPLLLSLLLVKYLRYPELLVIIFLALPLPLGKLVHTSSVSIVIIVFNS